MKSFLFPQKHKIFKDYHITDVILGEGVEFPVVLCINKATTDEYALKVTL